MKPRTNAQRQRQDKEFRKNGRYSKVNPCYGCAKSAGVKYSSHPLTDCDSPKGAHWGDTALCLCTRCYNATWEMTEPEQFYEYKKRFKK